MSLQDFRANVEAALRLLSNSKKGDQVPLWLNERAIGGMTEAGLEKLRADLGFPLGAAAARFRRIAREVAAADGFAEPQQIDEAAHSLRAIAEILKAFPST